ncbi:variable surface protein [Plasmodium gonderi]|uniref:Variable surface protein n=1 Tax=Plasmodium gonderi TaxID=77519 RepID=A0A1Y1JRL3_PLAGO|nr:variable surface protein [Plasmodium gonderi]GAW84125.1 variable surface protein [Plasmodium gonderi]
MEPLNEDEFETVLGNTESYNIYKKFDEENNLDVYTNYCAEFKTSNELNHYNDGNYCVKIAKNLDKLYKLDNAESYLSSCLHYKYWIYSKMLKLFNSGNNNVGYAMKYFLNLQKHISKKLEKYFCLYDFYRFDLDELNELNEEKYLYEYFKHYSSINNKITSIDKEKDTYVKYLKYIDKIYQKHKNDYCCDYYGSTGNCYHYFKCDENYNPNYLLCKVNNDKELSNCIPKDAILSENGSQGKDSGIINPLYFSCKEIKSEEGVPFLSCFVLRTTSKDSKRVRHDKTHQSIKLTNGYMSQAIRSIQNFECVENDDNHNINFRSFKCTPKNGTQQHNTGLDLKVDKLHPSRKEDQFEKKRPSFSESSKIDLRWTIDESILGCPANSSEKLRHKLCEYISELKRKGEIKNHTKTQIKKPIDSIPKQGNTSKKYTVSIDLEKLSCDPKDSDFCKNLKKSLLSKIKEEKKKGDNQDSGNWILFDGNTGTASVSESTPIITPNVLEQNYSIFSNFIFRVGIVVTMVIGTIFIFFLYYKVGINTFKKHKYIIHVFTGFGRWFDKIVLKKKNAKANFYYNANEGIPAYTPEYMYYNSKNKRSRISYTPA